MTGPSGPNARRSGAAAGGRAGLPFAAAAFLLAASFGAVARDVGFPPAAALAMSAVVHAGSGQFAALGVLAAGGGLPAAVGAAALMNGRFIPMGFALAPSLRGGRLRRVVEAQAVIDTSWALAARDDGTFDREFLLGCTAVQYAAWVAGTAAGAWAPAFDPEALGLDAVLPAFFLALLIGQARTPVQRGVAVAGAAIALALVPAVPPGVPVLAAAAAAMAGLRRRGPER